MANYRAGDVIRLTRQAVGMTQETLCENICSVETLSRIENGRHKVKRETYRRLMERMERIPEKNYAICTGKHMELLEEKADFEDAVSKYDYEKAEICLQRLKRKIGDGVLNEQYIAKAEAFVCYDNKHIDADQMIFRLEEAIRMTIPEYEQYLDKEYPYTEQEVLTLMNLAGAYRVKKPRNQRVIKWRKFAEIMKECRKLWITKEGCRTEEDCMEFIQFLEERGNIEVDKKVFSTADFSCYRNFYKKCFKSMVRRV